MQKRYQNLDFVGISSYIVVKFWITFFDEIFWIHLEDVHNKQKDIKNMAFVGIPSYIVIRFFDYFFKMFITRKKAIKIWLLSEFLPI